MINTLVDENVAIQKHLSQRELEHKHLADSIELNKAEEINDYRHQIQQLHEENNLLVKHLEDLRVRLPPPIPRTSTPTTR